MCKKPDPSQEDIHIRVRARQGLVSLARPQTLGDGAGIGLPWDTVPKGVGKRQEAISY